MLWERHGSTVGQGGEVSNAAGFPAEERAKGLRLGAAGAALEKGSPVVLTRGWIHRVGGERVGVEICGDDACTG